MVFWLPTCVANWLNHASCNRVVVPAHGGGGDTGVGIVAGFAPTPKPAMLIQQARICETCCKNERRGPDTPSGLPTPMALTGVTNAEMRARTNGRRRVRDKQGGE